MIREKNSSNDLRQHKFFRLSSLVGPWEIVVAILLVIWVLWTLISLLCLFVRIVRRIYAWLRSPNR